MRYTLMTVFAVIAAVLSGANGHAQAPPTYGEPITLERAKAAVAAAEAEAKKNNWNLTFAVVGPYGNLIYFQKNDRAANATIQIAQDKARTSALFRAPSKVFMERLAKGEAYVGYLSGVTPVGGGVPIVVGGKVIGAIGASGASADQDHQASSAGAAAVK